MDSYTLINHSGRCVELRMKGIITMADCDCPYHVVLHDPRNLSKQDIELWRLSKGGMKEGKRSQSYAEITSLFFRRMLPFQAKGPAIEEIPPRASANWKALDRKLSHLISHKASPSKIAAVAKKRAKRKALADDPNRRCAKCFNYAAACTCK